MALPAGLSYVIESAYYPETGEQEMPAGVDEDIFRRSILVVRFLIETE